MSDELIRAAAWDLISDDIEKQKVAYDIIKKCGGDAAGVLLEVAHEWDEEDQERLLGKKRGRYRSTCHIEWAINDVEAVDSLSDTLSDPNLLFRAFAVDALAGIDDPRVPELLYKAYEDKDANVRVNVISWLENRGDQQSYEIVAEALNDPEEAIRSKAASAMSEIGGVECIDLLLKALFDQSDTVACSAISSLKKLRSESAIEPLIGIISDASSKLAIAAIDYLKKMGDSRAIEPLLGIISSGTDTTVIYHALDTLTELDPEKAVELAIQMLDAPDGIMMDTAIYILGDLQATRASDSIVNALSNEDLYIRNLAATALAKMGDKRAFETLVTLLHLVPNIETVITDMYPDRYAEEDTNQYIRRSAAESLRILGDPSAIEPLVEALNDEYSGIYAAISLAHFGDDRGWQYLFDKLKTADRWPRMDIISAFGEIQDPRAIEPLLDSLTASDGYLADRVFQALINIGSNDAINAITSYMDADNDSGYWAIRELAWIGYEPAIERLYAETVSETEELEYGSIFGFHSINHPLITNLLLSMIDHPSANVRISAIYQFPDLSDSRVLGAIKARLQDPDRRVQTAAFTTLNEMNRGYGQIR